MNATLTRTRATNHDWRRHVLALVLFAVLVWYTVVSPSYAPAPLRPAHDADAKDAEERELETRPACGFATSPGTRLPEPRAREFGLGVDEDELDWPEIIGDD